MMNSAVAHAPVANGAPDACEDACEDARVSALYDALMREGYVIVPDAISAAQTEKTHAELKPWLKATPKCVGDFYGWETTRVGGLLQKAPSTQALVMHDIILALARRVLLPSCDCIQLNLTQAIRVHPGEDAQAVHRDEEMWPHASKPHPWLINVMWALTPFNEENGATRIWPRSHRQALDRGVDPRQSIAAEMAPGSALVFLGALSHGAGANRSAAPRDGIIVSYCLGWLKQYENAFLAYPKEIAAEFPAELRRLMGYQMHRPNLGGWEGRDPIEALSPPDGVARGHVDALTPEIAAELRALLGARAAADGA